MIMNIDNPLMKHVVSQVHPDPKTRMTAHLNIGIQSPMSFTVRVNPSLAGAFDAAKVILGDEVKKGPNGISVALTNFHLQSLSGKPTSITAATPTRTSINYMLEFEKAIFNTQQ